MAGVIDLGTLAAKVTLDNHDFHKGMQDVHDDMDNVEKKAGLLDSALKVGIGGIALAATAAVGLGAAMMDLGNEFDGAYDHIRVATGKTGEALEGLKEDFRAVAGSVPDSFEKVGSAIGDLHQRTGLAGQDLQTLSKTMLDLSRVTGGDVSSNIQLATRMFGDWSISTDNQSNALDKLYRAGQATGMGTERLMGLMTQFGGPMRQLGFSFEETAALMSKWENEGVNTELVMGSMRIAIGQLARDGIPLKEGLRDIISEIANMEDSSAATAKAMEVFGARAGPDMAAAIREGRFSIDELLDTIENGSDTIAQAADDTADFAEKWGKFTNQAKLALEPLANAVFGLAGDLVDRLAPAMLGLINMATPLAQALGEGLINAFDAVGEAISPFIEGLKSIQATMNALATDNDMDTISAGLQSISMHLNAVFGPETARLFDRITQAIGDFFEELGKVVGLMGESEGDMSGFAEAVESIAGGINAALDALTPFADFLTNVLTAAFDNIKMFITEFVSQFEMFNEITEGWLSPFETAILALSATIGRVFGPEAQEAFEVFASYLENVLITAQEIIAALIAAFETILPYIQPALEGILNVVQTVFGAILSFVADHSLELQNIITSVWTIISTLVTAAIETLAGVIKAGLQILAGDWEGAWETMKGVLQTQMNAIGTVVQEGMNIIGNVISIVASTIGAKAAEIGTNIVEGIKGGINAKAGELNAAITNLLSGPMGLLAAAKTAIDSKSPSTLFRDQVGMMIGAGIAVGIDASKELTINAIGHMSEAMLNEAWRLSKSDQFAQMGHDMIRQMAEAMEKGTPTAIQAVEKTGVAILAKLKTMLPPEMAEEIGGRFIAAVGEAIRGNPEGLIAMGEILDEMRTLAEQFVHEKHGEQIARSIFDAISAPSQREVMARGVHDTMLAFRDAIENESDQTAKAAGDSFKKLADAVRKALPPELANEVVDTLGRTFNQAFIEGRTDLLDGIEEWTVTVVDGLKEAKRQAEAVNVASGIADQFFDRAVKDKIQNASDNFMDTIVKGVQEGGDKAKKEAEKSAGQLAAAWKGKLDPTEFARVVNQITEKVEEAWATGNVGILGEVDELVNETNERIRQADFDKAMQAATQKLADNAFPPSIHEKMRREVDALFAVIPASMDEMTPQALGKIADFGTKVIDDIKKNLPPGKAQEALGEFTAALNAVLAGGGQEAIDSLRTVWSTIDQDIKDFKVKAELSAKSVGDMIVEGLAGEELKRKLGQKGAELVDTIGDALGDPTKIGKIKDKTAQLALALFNEWEDKLPKDKLRQYMAEAIDLLGQAMDPTNPNAAEALAKLQALIEKVNTEGKKAGTGIKEGIHENLSAAKQELDDFANDYTNTMNNLNSNFGANSVTPPGGKTPPGTNSGNLPGAQSPSINPGNSGGPGGTPGLPNPVLPPNTNLYWHQHPMYIVGSGGNKIPSGMSPSHQHGDSGHTLHQHQDQHYDYAQGFHEGGIFTKRTSLGIATFGDNQSGIEAVVPLERAKDFGFGGGGPVTLSPESMVALANELRKAPIVARVSSYELSNNDTDLARRGFRR